MVSFRLVALAQAEQVGPADLGDHGRVLERGDRFREVPDDRGAARLRMPGRQRDDRPATGGGQRTHNEVALAAEAGVDPALAQNL